MKKNKKVLKVVTAVTSLAVVSAISFGATLAYLSAQTERKINAFASGGVTIETNEEHFPKGTVEFKPGSTIAKDPTINVPASSEDTYLAFTVEYYRTYNSTTDSALESDKTRVFTDDSNNKWTKITKNAFETDYGTMNNWDTNWVAGTVMNERGKYQYVYPYYYKCVDGDLKGGVNGNLVRVASGTEKTDPLFESVTFKNDTAAMTPAPGKKTPEFKIVVTGYAVRADSYDPDDAGGVTALTELIKSNAANVGLKGMD